MNITTELMISLGINLILFIIIIFLIISVAKIKKRISKFLPEDKNFDIEKMLVEYNKNVLDIIEKEKQIFEKIESSKQELQNNIKETNNRIDDTKNQLKNAIQKIGFVRYNPFEEVGGELCYAIALLDENNNGVVINSIYSRETCYSYAKDITNGESLNHKLSDEEIQAIKLAINSNYK